MRGFFGENNARHGEGLAAADQCAKIAGIADGQHDFDSARFIGREIGFSIAISAAAGAPEY